MFGFQLIKWFWNLWDHLLTIILWNLSCLMTVGLFFYLLQIFLAAADGLPQVLPAALLSLLLLFCSTVLQHTLALSNYAIAKFERSEWKECLCRAWRKDSLRAAILMDLGLGVLFLIYFVSWRFYTQQGGLLSLMAQGLLFWLALLLLLSSGFYFPLLVREEFSIKKALRQSLVVCLDNFLLSLALGLVGLLLLVISFLPPLMLFFGPAGLGLWYEVSLRILYYKYQYIQQLPEEEIQKARSSRGNLRRRKPEIPWRALLREERERIGPRSLRNFIFPWKD